MSTIDDTGASIDRYAEVRLRIADAVRVSFGDAVGVDDEDTAVGKLVSIFSEAVADQNEAIEFAIASFDPDSASGTSLKKLVKMNGLTANEVLYSTVTVTLTANVDGATIPAGSKVNDPLRPDVLWATDEELTLGAYVSDTVTATCETPGYVEAEAGTLTQINTAVNGWSSSNNVAAATPGQNEETSAALRRRRDLSSKSYGLSTLSGVWSALADLDAVDEVFVWQNLDTQGIDAKGVPYRNLWAIVSGGADADIAEVLFKTAPLQTYGSESEPFTFLDNSYTMYFDRPTDTAITLDLDYKAISTANPAVWPADAETTIKEYLVDWGVINQTMGVDAIPELITAAATIIDGYYVDTVLIDGGSLTVVAEASERLVISTGNITVTQS